MITTETKAKRGKCLALVAVLAMVVCAFAVAMPAGDSDAAEATEVTKYVNVGTTPLTDGGKFYVDTTGLTITGPDQKSSGGATLYVKTGITVTLDGTNGANVNIVAATGAEAESSSASSTYKVTYIAGMTIVGADDGKYTVNAASSSTNNNVTILSTAPAGENSVYGVLLYAGSTSYTYYAEGADAGERSLSTSAHYIAVMNGSAVVNTKSGDSTVSQIELKDIVSTAGITVTCKEGGAMEFTGAASVKGTITMKQGYADVKNTALTIGDATLNAYAHLDDNTSTATIDVTSGAISATATWGSTVYANVVYGNVASNQTIVLSTDDGTVTFVDAAVTNLTVVDNATAASVEASVSVTVAGDGNGSLTYDNDDDSGTVIEGTEYILALTDNTEVTVVAGAVSAPATVNYGQSIIVSSGATLNVPATVTMNGKLYLSGTLSGSNAIVTVAGTDSEKKAEFRAFSGAELINVTIAEGTYSVVDISGVQATKYVYGTDKDGATYSQSQIVTVVDTYELTGTNAQVTIYGGLYVPEGTELILSKGATITVVGDLSTVVIEGTLTVEKDSKFVIGYQDATHAVKKTAGDVTVSGSVVSEGGIWVNSDSFVVKDGGIVNSDNEFSSDAMTVNAGGIVYLTGTAGITAMSNAGSVILDDVTISNSNNTSTISLTASGASVSLSEVVIDDNDTLTINDTGLMVGTNGTLVYTNSVVLAGTGSITVSGLEIVSSASVSSYDKKVYNYIDLSGSVSAESEASDSLTITVGGKGIIVTDSLVLGSDVELKFVANAALKVSGTLTALKGTIDDGTEATLNVTGLVQTSGAIQNDQLEVNAVYFKTTGSDKATLHNYSTIAAAIESEAAAIEVLGKVTMTESAEVPAGVTLKVDSGNELVVGSTDDRSVMLTLDDGAKASGSGTVTVYGSMYVETVKDCRNIVIVSDVKVTDDVSALYTNIYTALNEAEAGDVVTVTRDSAVELDSSITVKEGVVLSVPAGKSIAVANGKEIVITINGSVVAYSGIAGDFTTEDACSTLVIAGEFLTGESRTGDNLSGYNAYYNFDGAYYSVTDSDGTYVHITTIENAVLDAQDTEAIYVYGEVVADDIAIEGTSTALAVLSVEDGAVLTVDTLDLAYAKIVVDAGAQFNGTVVSDEGSVKLQNVESFSVVETDNSDYTAKTLTIEGTIAKADEATGAVKATVSVASGIVCAGAFDISGLDSFSIAEAAALEVTGAMKAKNMKIAGTLDVDNGASLTATGYIEVTGTLTVAEETSSKTAGTLSVPLMYVGISQSTVGSKSATIAAAAAVDAPAVTGLKAVYLGAGSTVSDEVVEKLSQSSDFSVEGAVVFTVYTSGSIDVYNIDYPDLAGAKFVNWQYTSAGKTYDVDATGEATVGKYATFTALMDYDVYKVTITADYGFADVFIDGAKVASIVAGVAAYVGDNVADDDDGIMLTAGTHTVEWKLKNNYNGDNITTSFNGAQFSKSFTISSDMDFSETTYKLVLTGAQEQGQVTPVQPTTNNDSGMKVTDYLLIVLVVLIAIMAIMVALRLMRS